MAEILVHRPNPAGSSTAPVLSHGAGFLRGPMYSAYSNLRESKLRMKKAGLSPSTKNPVQIIRKQPAPSQPEAFRSPTKSPPPVKPPPSRGGLPRGGSARVEEVFAMRSCASYQEPGSRKAAEESGAGPKKGIFGKTFSGLRRSTSKAAGWIG